MKTLRSRTRGVLFYLAGWSPLAVLFTIVMRYMDVGGWLIAAGYALTYLVPAIALGAFFWVKVEERSIGSARPGFNCSAGNWPTRSPTPSACMRSLPWFCGRRGGAQPSMPASASVWAGTLVRRAALPGAGGPCSIRSASPPSCVEKKSPRPRPKACACAPKWRRCVASSIPISSSTVSTHHRLVRSDPPRAEEALLQFAGLLRRVLALKRETADEVSLTEEMAFVDDYLAIERLRLGSVSASPAPSRPRLSSAAASLQRTTARGKRDPLRRGPAPRRWHCDPRRSGARRGGWCSPWPTTGRARSGHDRRSAGCGLSVIRRQLQLPVRERAAFRVDTAPGNGFRVTLALPAVKENTA